MFYKQALDGSGPRLIVAPVGVDMAQSRLSPDGQWLILSGTPASTPARTPTFYRVPIKGGVLQQLFEAKGLWDFNCTGPSANFCAYLAVSDDGRELIFTAFDSVTGKRNELFRNPTIERGYGYNWGLSPDRSQIVTVDFRWNSDEVTIIPSHGGQSRIVTVKGYYNLDSLDWAADSKGVFVGSSRPSGAILLYVDLNGNVHSLWGQPRIDMTWGTPSHDGRHRH
jgi:hypothetical protein